jgi:hypothetical protein
MSLYHMSNNTFGSDYSDFYDDQLRVTAVLSYTNISTKSGGNSPDLQNHQASKRDRSGEDAVRSVAGVTESPTIRPEMIKLRIMSVSRAVTYKMILEV